MLPRILATWLFLVTSCIGQIQVPIQNKPFDPIIASIDVSSIPENSEIKIRWNIASASNATSTLLPTGDNGAHIWASPGKHRVSATITWIQFEEIKIPSENGTRVIKNLINWDTDFYARIFLVGTPEPEPDPDPDPPTPDPDPEPTPEPGPRWIIMIHEVQDTDATREDLWADILEYNQNNQKHPMVQIDQSAVDNEGNTPEWLSTYLSLLEENNVELPGIIITTKEEPIRVLHVGSAPTSLENYKSLLEENGG